METGSMQQSKSNLYFNVGASWQGRQVRAGQDRAGQGRAEQGRAGQADAVHDTAATL